MNKEKMFRTFLESLRDEKNTHMIDAITEGFALTEGFRVPEVHNGAAAAIDASKSRRMSANKQSVKLSDEQVADNKAKFAREEKSAKQQNWRVSGSMASVVKFAQVQPMEVEKWIEETLKPAIKAGKKDMDGKFGTETAKRGIFDRVKSAAKSFTEGADSNPDELYRAMQDQIADFAKHIEYDGVDTALDTIIQGYCGYKKYDTELSSLSDIKPVVVKLPEFNDLVKRITGAQDKIKALYSTRDWGGEIKRVMMASVVLPMAQLIDTAHDNIIESKKTQSTDFDF